jgi:mRNA interferase RelE/StbE
MELVFKTAAAKRLAEMPKAHARKMLATLQAIAADPKAPQTQVKKLVGTDNIYRLRVGDWRAVYELVWEDDVLTVIVIDVRGSVYR